LQASFINIGESQSRSGRGQLPCKPAADAGASASHYRHTIAQK
jgi:hypothetical protein